MGLGHSPSIVMDGLVLALDAGNSRCYSGSGITVNGLVGIGGTLVNGVGFTSANSGSFTFDGSNDYIVIPTSSTFDLGTGSATIIAWFKTTSGGCIVSKRNVSGFQLYADSTKLYADGAGTAGKYSSQVVNTGKVFLGAVVYDRANSLMRLYINGVEDGNIALGDTTLTDIADINIGRITLSGNPRDYFNGTIYQVSIYNRALSAQEIKQNYNATKKRYGL